VIKFNPKDWSGWYRSIDSYFGRTLGVRGVTLDWVYREQAELTPGMKYRSISDELKATLLLEGSHFIEDSEAVYEVVASSTLGTLAYSHVEKFEKERDGRKAMLALKTQFGEAYNLSMSKAAKDVIWGATFSSPSRRYTYDRHMAMFANAFNVLALIGEPVLEQTKVRLFCNSLKEKFLKHALIQVQMSPDCGSNLGAAMARLRLIRYHYVSHFAEKGDERYVSELDTEGGHKKKRRGKRKQGQGSQLHGFTDKQWRDMPAAKRARIKALSRDIGGHD
jgi:hypothetical protein